MSGPVPVEWTRVIAKRHRAKECSPEFFEVLKSDYLRLEAPPFTDCHLDCRGA